MSNWSRENENDQIKTMDDAKPAATAPAAASASSPQEATVTMIAKFGKQIIEFTDLPPPTTIGQVKEMIREKTGILPLRQKLIGLKGNKGVVVGDDTPLSNLKAKGNNNSNNGGVVVHQFILMGTPEEQIFVDPSEKDDLPDIIDDFDLDFNAGSEEVSLRGVFCIIIPYQFIF